MASLLCISIDFSVHIQWIKSNLHADGNHTRSHAHTHTKHIHNRSNKWCEMRWTCQHTGTKNQNRNTHWYGCINQKVKFFTISFQHANHTFAVLKCTWWCRPFQFFFFFIEQLTNWMVWNLTLKIVNCYYVSRCVCPHAVCLQFSFSQIVDLSSVFKWPMLQHESFCLSDSFVWFVS